MSKKDESINLDFQAFKKLEHDSIEIMPAIVQHVQTREILILGYVNSEALRLCYQKKKVIFWSRSRKCIWMKGETSGNFIHLHEIRVNCEGNSLIFLGQPETQSVCHTVDREGKHRATCFYRRLFCESGKSSAVDQVSYRAELV